MTPASKFIDTPEAYELQIYEQQNYKKNVSFFNQ